MCLYISTYCKKNRVAHVVVGDLPGKLIVNLKPKKRLFASQYIGASPESSS